MNPLSWRSVLLLGAIPACTLLEPLDNATPDSAVGGSGGTAGAGALAGTAGGAGRGGSTGSGGSTGAHAGTANGGTPAGGSGAAPSGGAGGVPGRGGAGGAVPPGGAGGAVPPGGAGGTAPSCRATSTSCTQTADCCQNTTPNGATCIDSDLLCHANCTDGDFCVTGCCAQLTGQTYGVCAAPSVCGCTVEGGVCTTNFDCCGGSAAYCDGTCHRLCTTGNDCPTACCNVNLGYCVAATFCQ